MNCRAVFCLVLLIAALLPAGSAVAQTPAPATLVDLPAAFLTPEDAEAEGLVGFGRFGNGHQRELEEYAQHRAAFQGMPIDVVLAALNEFGWMQGYSSQLGLPDLPGTQNAQPTEVLFSSIYQYATPEGASSGLAFVTDYSGVTGASVETNFEAPALGDEALWSRTKSATIDEQGPSDELAVVFRVGDLIAAVGSIDYTVTAHQVATPTAVDAVRIGKVAALASMVQEHLADIDEAPGLSSLISRLGSDAGVPPITDEGYRRIDGGDIAYFNGYTDDFPGSGTTATDVYEYTAALGQGSGDPYDPYFALRIYQFPDDASASDFLARSRSLTASDGTPISQGDPIGDESVLFPESFEAGPGITVRGYHSLVRVGTLVSSIIFESGDHQPNPDVVIKLAEAQASCLNSGICPALPIPTNW